jgi:hypothetical protein
MGWRKFHDTLREWIPSHQDAVGGSTRLSGAVRQILHAYFLTVCADLLTVSDIIIWWNKLNRL